MDFSRTDFSRVNVPGMEFESCTFLERQKYAGTDPWVYSIGPLCERVGTKSYGRAPSMTIETVIAQKLIHRVVSQKSVKAKSNATSDAEGKIRKIELAIQEENTDTIKRLLGDTQIIKETVASDKMSSRNNSPWYSSDAVIRAVMESLNKKDDINLDFLHFIKTRFLTHGSELEPDYCTFWIKILSKFALKTRDRIAVNRLFTCAAEKILDCDCNDFRSFEFLIETMIHKGVYFIEAGDIEEGEIVFSWIMEWICFIKDQLIRHHLSLLFIITLGESFTKTESTLIEKTLMQWMELRASEMGDKLEYGCKGYCLCVDIIGNRYQLMVRKWKILQKKLKEKESIKDFQRRNLNLLANPVIDDKYVKEKDKVACKDSLINIKTEQKEAFSIEYEKSVQAICDYKNEIKMINQAFLRLKEWAILCAQRIINPDYRLEARSIWKRKIQKWETIICEVNI